MFKKWHVDNKVLEKLFHERKDTIKVFSGGRHTEIKKTPKTALLKIIKVIFDWTQTEEKVSGKAGAKPFV